MKTLADAGYAPSHLKVLRQAARAGKGLVLISGITGSGKSNTLKLFIEDLPGLEHLAVYTIEDPVEQEIRRAHQIEVLRNLADEAETRRTYAQVMKAILRGDPDACSVGEIRDDLTARFGMQLALTGHMAFATVHAHLLENIVPRLSDKEIGLDRHSLCGHKIIQLLLYQALVPLLCTKCALPADVAKSQDAEVAELLPLLSKKFGVSTTALRFARKGGCKHCRGLGTRGRTLVAEMLQPDRAWLAHVRAGDDDAAMRHYRSRSDRNLHSADMSGKTVFEHTLWKALQGWVDPRACHEFDSFEQFEVLSPAAPAEACA